jgi:putative ABC transport system permease protein
MSYSGEPSEAEFFRVTEETNQTSELPILYLGERALSEWGGKVGDTITLNTPSGTSDFYVKGSAQTAHYSGYVAFVNDSILGTTLNWPYQHNIAISAEDAVNTSLIYTQLWENYGDELSRVSSASQNVEQSKQALTGMNELMQGLLLLIIGLSAIGISNTLFMNTLERIKEIGIMRAIGFTKQQVKFMIIAEGLVIGIVGVIVGTAYGVLAIYLNSQSDDSQALLSFTVPWVSLLIAIVAGILFTIVAAWLPSVTASRVPVKDAISYE